MDQFKIIPLIRGNVDPGSPPKTYKGFVEQRRKLKQLKKRLHSKGSSRSVSKRRSKSRRSTSRRSK